MAAIFGEQVGGKLIDCDDDEQLGRRGRGRHRGRRRRRLLRARRRGTGQAEHGGKGGDRILELHRITYRQTGRGRGLSSRPTRHIWHTLDRTSVEKGTSVYVRVA